MFGHQYDIQVSVGKLRTADGQTTIDELGEECWGVGKNSPQLAG